MGPSCPTRDGLMPCHSDSVVLCNVATLQFSSTFCLASDQALHICIGAAFQFCQHFLLESFSHLCGFCGVLECLQVCIRIVFSVGKLDEWIQTASMQLHFPWG